MDWSISSNGNSDYYFFYFILLILGFIEIPIFDANSVDPAQMLHTSSDLGLHCLPFFARGGGGGLERGLFRLKWIKDIFFVIFMTKHI